MAAQHRANFAAPAITIDDARSPGVMFHEAGSRGLACRIKRARVLVRCDHGAVLEVLNFVSHTSLAKEPLRRKSERKLKGGMTA
jgi:hypothetical protein